MWLGNPDTSVLTNGNSSIPAEIIGKVMEYAHKEVYGPAGNWNAANGGSWYQEPDGIQKIGGEMFPSWYNKNQGNTNAKLAFDRVSKKRATDCTPDAARIEVDVIKSTDPISKRDNYISTDGYDATKEDDVHECDDIKPSVGSINVEEQGGSYRIEANVVGGTHDLAEVEIRVGDTAIATLPISSSGSVSTRYTPDNNGSQRVTATVRDSAYYTGSGSTDANFNADRDTAVVRPRDNGSRFPFR